MKILKWILIVAAVLVILLAAFLAYMGMIFPLKTYEAQMGPFLIAYESFTGPYAQTGPVFEKIFGKLEAEGIGTTRGLGIYYDDPSKVPAEELRSDCGVVIEIKDRSKFWRVSRKFSFNTIHQKDSVVIEFPIRNMLSYMLGPMKAYPALMKHAQEKGYQIAMTYELYDETQKKIFFVLVIKK